MVLLSPRPELYIQYGYIRNNINDLSKQIVIINSAIQNISILSAMLTGIYLIYTKNPRVHNILFITIIGLINCYINGKRAIIVYFLVSMLIYFVFKKNVKFKSLMFPIIAICCLFIVFNFSYLNKYKGQAHSYKDWEGQYYSFVNDFSRTGELRTEIYHELYSDQNNILEYRGQTFVFNLLFFIPRYFWSSKPYPYSIYLTAADLMLTKPEPIGWGMTTNLFGETLANAGFLGLIIFTICLGMYCRFVDKNGSFIFRLTNIVFFIILNAVQLSAIIPLYLIWIILLVKNLPIKMKKIKKGTAYELATKHY